MPAQQPEVRRSNRSAATPDAPPSRVSPSGGPDTEDAGKRRAVPKDNRPGNKPKRDQDKPNPERVATDLRTRPLDNQDAEEARGLPQPFRTVAYGAGVVLGTGVKLAEVGWNTAGRAVRRVRGRR